MVVCAIDKPRSAIISTRSRKLSLNRRYQRTHRMMTSRSKWRPSNSSCMLFSLPIPTPSQCGHYHSRSAMLFAPEPFIELKKKVDVEHRAPLHEVARHGLKNV